MTTSDAEPTTKAEREQHLKDLASLDAEQGGLSTLNRDFTRRLITDVERLEANAAFMRDDYTREGARGCRLCVYENGVFQRPCRLHVEIERLEEENRRWRNHQCVFQ